MPTVKKDRDGYNIISNRRGRFITHQVTPDGVALLLMRAEDINNLEIDLNTLMYLREKGYAYIAGRSPHRPQPKPAAHIPPSPPPPPEPASSARTTVPCRMCLWPMSLTATFCSHCGEPLSGPLRSKPEPVAAASPIPPPAAPPTRSRGGWAATVLFFLAIAAFGGVYYTDRRGSDSDITALLALAGLGFWFWFARRLDV